MDILRMLRREKYALTYALIGMRGLYNQGWNAMKIDTSHYLPANIANEVEYPQNEMVSTEFEYNNLYRVAVNRMSFHIIGTTNEIIRTDEMLWGAVHREPTIHFLTQIRNGVFHGNQFNFQGDQPKHNAEWREFEITEEMEGERVFTDIRGEIEYTAGELELIDGLLEFGDAIALLNDVIEVVSDHQ